RPAGQGRAQRIVRHRAAAGRETRCRPAPRPRCARRGVMAPFVVNPDNVREFKRAADFHAWLSEHHQSAAEVWIKIHKVGSGLPSITPREAIDVVLCWGWIDG